MLVCDTEQKGKKYISCIYMYTIVHLKKKYSVGAVSTVSLRSATLST